MTIRPGEQWGEAVAAPSDMRIARSDAEVAAAISRAGERPVLVRGGDLHSTLGAPSSTTTTALRLPIDAMHVLADTRQLVAVAHVVARHRGRRGWWRGPIIAVMNVERLGRWDVAPRAHPNDGRLDVVEVAAEMSMRQRWHAVRRLPSGTHVPHPAISIRRVTTVEFELDGSMGVWVDGRPIGDTRSLTVSVAPDAALIYV